jgi:hypothetical protein
MTTPPPGSPDLAPKTRDELVAMVAGAHSGSGYTDAALAGRTLAAQSKLPRVIAENLGAGFGQWTFFPEAAEIVDFALAYVPPSTEEDLWVLARSWAADDAAARHTLMALVGREIVQHELRRVDVAPLRQLLEETRPTPARALRESLGLAVAAAPPTKAEPRKKKAAAAAPVRAPAAAAPVPPTRMPKPELKRPAKAEAAPPSRRFVHPKFGEGVLASQDGAGPDAKLTIKFESGPKTLLARYVAEIPT